MKISISNLAWLNKEEDLIADLLQEFQVQGIDIALTKIWQNPLTVSLSEIKSYRSFWQNVSGPFRDWAAMIRDRAAPH